MFTVIARWFEPLSISEEYRRGDYLILALILATGATFRFWGLGNVGLHGDEETMAMPAMAILDTGEPLLPSGMYYGRALINIYLMSASAWMFGESEWAFRLPSAVVGSLMGLAAFYMGRRFLPPKLNLAFVATIAFLPGMIEVSQTARMYVFFATCMIWAAACIFRWERDQQLRSLAVALFAWVLCMHFHRLGIFAAPLFVFPGLSRQSWKQLIQGVTAIVIGCLFLIYYDHWISMKYPQGADRPLIVEDGNFQSAFEIMISGNEWLFGTSLVLVLGVLVALVMRLAFRATLKKMIPLLIVGLGLLGMTMLQYHIGGILLILGIVFWLREPDLSNRWIVVPILLAASLTTMYLGMLYDSGLYPGRKLIGALIGLPSVWPILRFTTYSPLAAGLYGLILIFALRRFATGYRLPIHFLFFIMAVWVPLFFLGFFAWNVPPRYAQGQLGFFLLCTFAGMTYVATSAQWLKGRLMQVRSMNIVLVLICLAIINPIALWRTVNSGYESHPDHKGAASFINGLNLDAASILIAEDVLQQTYYLGKVDYSLRPISDALHFSIVRDGKLFDQYTGAPVIGTGTELLEILDASRTDVFIIGSGENWPDEGERLFRTHGIAEVLHSDRLEVVYNGRDNKTKIWKLQR